MLKKVFLLTVIACLFSCKSEQTIPDNIISEEEMISMLIDIRIAEGKVNALNLPSDTAKSLFKYVERKLFEEHKLDSADYMQSYEYYMLNSEEFLKITDTVIDSLKVRLQKVTSNN